MIPTPEKCIELLERYGVTSDTMVYKHSMKVRDVSMLLANKLFSAGESIDLKLMEASALLHDIRKYDEIREKEQGNLNYKHNIEGALTVEREGFPELRPIIENHLFYNPIIWSYSIEGKVLCYSDRRIKMNIIVSLAERYSDLIGRYPHFKEELLADQDRADALEKELFSKLDIKPEELEKLVG